MIKKYSRKKNNRGSTMVETLVSFVVIAAVLAALYAIVSFSTRLWMNSVDAANIQQSFTDEIARINPNTSAVDITHYTAGPVIDSEDGKQYADFELVSVDSVSGEATTIKLNNISADSYVSIEKSVEDENIAAPKAIVFKHKSQLEDVDDGD